MYFDNIVGNPPYNHNTNKNKAHPLWVKFIDNSIKLLFKGGLLSMIVPPTWVSYNNKVRNHLFNRKIIKANFNESSFKEFNASSSFSYFTCLNELSNENYKSSVTLGDGSHMLHSFYGTNVFPFRSKKNTYVLKLLEHENKLKVIGIGTPFRSDSVSNILSKKDKYHINPLFHLNTKTLYSKLVHPHQNKHKVVLNKTGTWNPFYSYEYGYTHLNFAVLSKSKVYAIRIEEYLNSKLIKSFVSEMDIFGARDKYTIEQIPTIDFSKELSDTEVYKHFNLTEEEIQLIESDIN